MFVFIFQPCDELVTCSGSTYVSWDRLYVLCTVTLRWWTWLPVSPHNYITLVQPRTDKNRKKKILKTSPFLCSSAGFINMFLCTHIEPTRISSPVVDLRVGSPLTLALFTQRRHIIAAAVPCKFSVGFFFFHTEQLLKSCGSARHDVSVFFKVFPKVSPLSILIRLPIIEILTHHASWKVTKFLCGIFVFLFSWVRDLCSYQTVRPTPPHYATPVYPFTLVWFTNAAPLMLPPEVDQCRSEISPLSDFHTEEDTVCVNWATVYHFSIFNPRAW